MLMRGVLVASSVLYAHVKQHKIQKKCVVIIIAGVVI
jgi:hypothetical protein